VETMRVHVENMCVHVENMCVCVRVRVCACVRACVGACSPLAGAGSVVCRPNHPKFVVECHRHLSEHPRPCPCPFPCKIDARCEGELNTETQGHAHKRTHEHAPNRSTTQIPQCNTVAMIFPSSLFTRLLPVVTGCPITPLLSSPCSTHYTFSFCGGSS
jgi:hypothetical protein